MRNHSTAVTLASSAILTLSHLKKQLSKALHAPTLEGLRETPGWGWWHRGQKKAACLRLVRLSVSDSDERNPNGNEVEAVV